METVEERLAQVEVKVDTFRADVNRLESSIAELKQTAVSLPAHARLEVIGPTEAPSRVAAVRRALI